MLDLKKVRLWICFDFYTSLMLEQITACGVLVIIWAIKMSQVSLETSLPLSISESLTFNNHIVRLLVKRTLITHQLHQSGIK